MLNINHNQFASRSFHSLRHNQSNVMRGFERLSSGLRINSAKDDAAGLSISTRMNAQIRGVNQSIRNSNDGISLLQTAEGALNESTNILQRMRELVVQSGNEILSTEDRNSIQGELNELKDELNRINETSNFNGQQIFSQHNTISLAQSVANGGDLNGYKVIYDEDITGHALADAAERMSSVIANLQASWLREAEGRVEEQYGLFGNGGTIEVDFLDGGDGNGGVAAFVASSTPQRLHIDLFDFPSTNQPHGGNSPVYSDRIIAHEFVHIAMNANNVRQSNIASQWFNEGAAELIHGGTDEHIVGRNDAQLQTLVDEAFDDDPINYGGAYLAARYLHQEIKNQGGDGLKDFFTALKSNGNDFDAALGLAGYADQAALSTDFATNGLAFAQSIRDNATTDTGAIGGFGVDGGDVLTAENIIPNEVFSTTDKNGGKQYNLHIGSSSDSSLSTSIGSFNVNAMGLETLNVVDFNKVNAALSGLNDALEYVSSQRSEIGALQNRLTSTINNLSVNMEMTSASRSRIMDADFANETADLTKGRIIQRASVSMLAQANNAPRLALALLR